MCLTKLKYLFFLCFIFLCIDNYAQRSNPLQKNKKFKKSIKKKIKDAIKETTKSCKEYNGLFKFYQSKKDGKSFIEIDTSHIGNEFIYFSYFENGVVDAGVVKGIGSKIIRLTSF